MITKLPYMKLIARLAHRYNRAMGPCVVENGLAKGQGQSMILDNLAKRDGCIQRELAQRTGMEPASITAALSDMEQKGLIERRSSAEDRRVYTIHLTERGKEVSDRVLGEYNRVCEQVVLRGFSEKEKETLLDYLKRMNRNITDNEMF